MTMEHLLMMDNDDDIHAVRVVCSSSCLDLHYFSLRHSVYLLIVYILFPRYKISVILSVRAQKSPARQAKFRRNLFLIKILYCLGLYVSLCASPSVPPPFKSSVVFFSSHAECKFSYNFSPRLLNKM